MDELGSWGSRGSIKTPPQLNLTILSNSYCPLCVWEQCFSVSVLPFNCLRYGKKTWCSLEECTSGMVHFEVVPQMPDAVIKLIPSVKIIRRDMKVWRNGLVLHHNELLRYSHERKLPC